MPTLRPDDVERFVTDGFVRLDEAFSRELAAAAVSDIFGLAEIDPTDRSAWTEPVIRVPGSTDPAVIEAINTPALTGAIDQLVGTGQWQRRSGGYGTFAIRFPSDADPGDAGWHIDGSFGEPPHYRVNLASRGRALLLLMLFTDVSVDDAPTRIRVGSHFAVARALAEIGDEGCTFVPEVHAPATLEQPIEAAVGRAGTVYLCHPFLVHAATWPHRGSGPRVVGQPCIHHPEGEWLGGFDYDAQPDTPVKRAVSRAGRDVV